MATWCLLLALLAAGLLVLFWLWPDRELAVAVAVVAAVGAWRAGLGLSRVVGMDVAGRRARSVERGGAGRAALAARGSAGTDEDGCLLVLVSFVAASK
jgi:hypothetical protein